MRMLRSIQSLKSTQGKKNIASRPTRFEIALFIKVISDLDKACLTGSFRARLHQLYQGHENCPAASIN